MLCTGACEVYWGSNNSPTDSAALDLSAVTTLEASTAPYLGPLTLVLVDASCDDSMDQWTWDAQTLGWTQRAIIDWLHYPTLTSETHTLPSVESGPWGHWDRLARVLAVSRDGTWSSDLATSFTCSLSDETTQIVRIYDATDTLADCVVWGMHSDAVVDPALTWSQPLERSDELASCRPWE